MTSATTGVGTITLGSPVAGFLSFGGAGAQDQDIISYAISDGSNSETGWGVYTTSGTTLTRNVFNSTNGNAPISLSGSAVVFITISSNDLAALAQSPKLLNTITGSGVNYLSDTTSITSAYPSFELNLINMVPATNSVDICLQFYANGSWQTGTTYQVSLLTGVASSGNAWRQGSAAASIPLSYTNRVGVTGNWGGLNARLKIYNPAADNVMFTGESCYYDTTAASLGQNTFAGAWVGAYPITGVRVFAGTSAPAGYGYNISGTMKIYGNP